MTVLKCFFKSYLLSGIFVFGLSFCYPHSLFSQRGQDSKMIAGYTAKPLKKGQAYVHTIDGFLYEAEYGLTSFLSVGVGGNMVMDRAFWRSSYQSAGWATKIKAAVSINEYFSLGLASHFFINDDRFDKKEFGIMPTALASVEFFKVQLNVSGGVISTLDIANRDKNFSPIFSIGAVVPIFKDELFLVSENWLILFETNKIDNARSFSTELVLRWNYKRFSLEGGTIRRFIDDGDGTFTHYDPTGGLSFFF